jgi:hypothetical protein
MSKVSSAIHGAPVTSRGLLENSAESYTEAGVGALHCQARLEDLGEISPDHRTEPGSKRWEKTPLRDLTVLRKCRGKPQMRHGGWNRPRAAYQT